MEDMLAGLGKEFQDAREQHGWTIDEIADRLRIRRLYLLAIESGNFAEIPGTFTYVTGFLRTYANFLELDAESLIGRYKEVAGDRMAEHEYKFPKESLPPSRRPYGKIGLVFAVGVIGYGLWTNADTVKTLFSNNTSNVAIGQQISSRYTQYSEKIEKKVGQTAESVKKTAEAALIPAPKKMPFPPQPPTDGDADGYMLPVNEEEAAERMGDTFIIPQTPEAEPVAAQAQAAAPDATQTSPAQGRDMISENVEPVFRQNAPAAPKAVETAAPAEAAPVATPQPQAQPAAAAATPFVPEEKKETPAAAAAAPAVALEETTKPAAALAPGKGSHIVLLAREDTWVKVVDENNQLIIERPMKTGDTYFLPDKKNLKITTGNAESIEVFVDGDTHAFLGTLKDLQNGKSASASAR
ncbi:MAG: hypothetical protein K0R63_746 [Rickettsiales bacterium]|jgi:cytoskeleton protein RodZ|nr:hypothetical protein [Rickettsiales bacterium]